MPNKPALLTALLPTLLLAACASDSPLSPVPQVPLIVSRQMTPPALPASAQQPTPPPECLPTCSNTLMTERERWLILLTAPTPPALPASGPMGAPARP